MLKLLAVLGYILLAVIVILVWVIVVPRNIYLEYTKNEGITVKINIFIFKLQIYPFKFSFAKKEEKADKVQPTDKKEEKPSEKKEKVSDKSFVNQLPKGTKLVKEIFSTVGGVLKILLKGIKFKDVSFTIPISGEDAYETQQLYGKATTGFYIFNTFLQRYVKIYYKSPIFIADFANQHENIIYFYCKIQASPCIIITVAIFLFKKYKQLLKR